MRLPLDAWAAAPDGAARWTPATRQHRLGWIRRAARALRPDDAPPPPPLAAPYSRAKVLAYRAHALAEPDPCRRHAVLAVLALAAGTGLPPHDILRTTGHHVRQDPTTGAVLIRVGTGSLAREIPCTGEHELDLLAAARRAGPRWTVDPDDARPTRERRRLAVATTPPGQPPVSPRRGRATWLRAPLASGTRLHTLMTAAGLNSPSSLPALTAGLPPLTDVDRRAILRGP